MTKLEELTALLVNEINDFNQGIEKLDIINNQLKETKIKMDISEYKDIIDEHQLKMESHLNALKSFENRFESKITQAKIYPTWAVVVFITALFFSLGSIVYFIFIREL